MEYTKIFPIYEGSDFYIHVPNLEFFTNKILNQHFFSFTKLSVEWWMLLNTALSNIPSVNGCYDFQDEKLINKIAQNMDQAWDIQKRKRPWKSSVKVISRILKMIVSEKPDNFFIGVTDRHVVKNNKFPLPSKANNNLVKTMQRILPSDKQYLHALCWRLWAAYGQIHDFMRLVSHKNIVLIGPNHLKNLGNKLKLKKFNYIEIHSNDALLYVEDTKAEILSKHKYFLKNNDDVLYFLVGGSVAMWLISELHGILNNAYMIDIGRVFDVYYFFDPIRKQKPQWYFGTWLLEHKPLWTKDVSIKNKYNVRIFKL